MMQDEKLVKSYEDAIDCLNKNKPTSGYYMLQESVDMATKALEEVQQYRQIGTVEECREAVGKMRPKEPWKDRENNLRSCDYEWKCPICGHIVGDDEDTYFCKHCGQKVWG